MCIARSVGECRGIETSKIYADVGVPLTLPYCGYISVPFRIYSLVTGTAIHSAHHMEQLKQLQRNLMQERWVVYVRGALKAF